MKSRMKPALRVVPGCRGPANTLTHPNGGVQTVPPSVAQSRQSLRLANGAAGSPVA